MRHIHLDPLGGIAGDMFVAAMLDAFPAYRESVFADIAAVLPPEAGLVCLESVMKNGIHAKHFSLNEPNAVIDRHDHHSHDHAHDHDHHHTHGHCHKAQALHGSYGAIKSHIESAVLTPGTAKNTLGIFAILAKAEAYIHGVPEDDVHFHELAAWDTLMDIVASGSLIAALGPTTWSLSPLPLGSGVVQTQHGLLPVPAPATARILEGYPWRSDDIPGERVTPTGAAIIRYLVPPDSLNERPEGVSCTHGYGAGTKDFSALPNILRVNVFDQQVSQPIAAGDIVINQIVLIQFDIDDMSGEEIGVAVEHLRSAAGVLDLVLIPAQGKKNRPSTLFQLQVLSKHLNAISRLIFTETSTIGLRWCKMERHVLPRTHYQNDAGLPLKSVDRPEGGQTVKLEMDAIQSINGLATRRRAKNHIEGNS